MLITRRALLIVDVQNDFCEGGALGVDGGNAVAESVARLSGNYRHVITTQDWHNPLPDTNGGHFDEWPVHCVAGTHGAELHPVLAETLLGRPVLRIRKGQGRPDYSGFQGVDPVGVPLEVRLKYLAGVTSLDVVGLATDYCVIETAIDAVHFGRSTRVLWDHTAAVMGADGVTVARSRFAEAVA